MHRRKMTEAEFTATKPCMICGNMYYLPTSEEAFCDCDRTVSFNPKGAIRLKAVRPTAPERFTVSREVFNTLKPCAVCGTNRFTPHPGSDGSVGTFSCNCREYTAPELTESEVAAVSKNYEVTFPYSAFSKVLQDIQAMHDRKRQDYGTDGDPYANVRAVEDFNVEPWLGAILKCSDKLSRIKTFTHKGSLTNEGVADSLLDNAVYACIALVLWREKQTDIPRPGDTIQAGKAYRVTAVEAPGCEGLGFDGSSAPRERPSEQDEFDQAIGRLDHILSKLVRWSHLDTLPEENKQTLKHHSEDMIAAGRHILKKLNRNEDITDRSPPTIYEQLQGANGHLDSGPHAIGATAKYVWDGCHWKLKSYVPNDMAGEERPVTPEDVPSREERTGMTQHIRPGDIVYQDPTTGKYWRPLTNDELLKRNGELNSALTEAKRWNVVYKRERYAANVEVDNLKNELYNLRTGLGYERSQAASWIAVCNLCRNFGMPVLGSGTGQENVLQFITESVQSCRRLTTEVEQITQQAEITIERFQNEITQWITSWTQQSGTIKDLRAFKSYVHEYLDKRAIPSTIAGPHSKEGCRIGDRLDYVFAEMDKAKAELDKAACGNNAHFAAWLEEQHQKSVTPGGPQQTAWKENASHHSCSLHKVGWDDAFEYLIELCTKTT